MLLAVLFAMAGQPAAAQTGPPMSLERIRARLARPPALDLTVAQPAPHFHVEVQGRQFYRDIPPIWDTTGNVTPALPRSLSSQGAPALIQVDLSRLGRRGTSAIVKAREAKAARSGRQEVDEALRQFCVDQVCDAR